jgi:hypothetical protein
VIILVIGFVVISIVKRMVDNFRGVFVSWLGITNPYLIRLVINNLASI